MNRDRARVVSKNSPANTVAPCFFHNARVFIEWHGVAWHNSSRRPPKDSSAHPVRRYEVSCEVKMLRIVPAANPPSTM